MSLVGFKAQNHRQQVVKHGANDKVDDRSTSAGVFDPLNERFGFTIDVAASADNAKCERFYSIEDDGLAQTWTGERVWCNPPYSDIGAWVQKAWAEWQQDARGCGDLACTENDHLFWPKGDRPEVIVMLLPANRTEQRWWQDMVEPFRDQTDSELRVEFLSGRPRFDKPGGYTDPRGNRPPFGCCLLIWEAVPDA